MPLSLAYWILMLVWLIGCGVYGMNTPATGRVSFFSGGLLLFLLFLVIGLKLFGAPIRG